VQSLPTSCPSNLAARPASRRAAAAASQRHAWRAEALREEEELLTTHLPGTNESERRLLACTTMSRAFNDLSNPPPAAAVHPSFGYCPDRVRGYASKLSAVCDDVSTHAGKTLVLVHSTHGFKLLLRLLEARFPNEVLGYVGCNPSAIQKWDDEIKLLIGDKHNEADKAKGCCGCHICRFNDPKNLHGEESRIMVADAKFCSEGVSFFGVRQVALVDMPENAAQFLQRVGRAVRFNGHAGLPPEKSNVRLCLYCATLPPEPTDEDEEPQQCTSADELQKEDLAKDLKAYQNELKKLETDAVDFDQLEQKPLWDESSSAVDLKLAMAEQEDDLQYDLELEAKAKMMAKEAKAKAAEDAKLMAEKAEAAKTHLELSMTASPENPTYASSEFKKMDDALMKRESAPAPNLPDGCNKPITIEELWASTEAVVRHYEGTMVALRYIQGLKRSIIQYCYKNLTSENDLKTVSMLMWAAQKHGGVKAELCSLLNRAFREDGYDKHGEKTGRSLSVLEHAVLVQRAIKSNLITYYMKGQRGQVESSFREWPEGPNCPLNQGWSSEKDATWRGGGMPKADLEWFLQLEQSDCKRFRSKMFLASSFNRSVAMNFCEKQYDGRKDPNDPEGSGKVLIKIEFEHHNCCHVNYIDKSEFPQEKEFLLPPYSAFELKRVIRSSNLDGKPHMIVIKALRDNQDEKEAPMNLPLANRL